jgi:hypothetical protein
MTDLRKAAEMALEALESFKFAQNPLVPQSIYVLRQALAQHEHPLDIYERAYFAGKQDGIDETIALLKVKNT